MNVLCSADAVAEEDEVIDDGLPQGDLGSHMSWRDPDKGESNIESQPYFSCMLNACLVQVSI